MNVLPLLKISMAGKGRARTIFCGAESSVVASFLCFREQLQVYYKGMKLVLPEFEKTDSSK